MSDDPRSVIAGQRAALGDSPTVLQVARALTALDALEPVSAGLKTLRLGVVSSFTFEPLVKPLRARGYVDGFRLEVHVAPFGQYVQELIDPASGLHRFQPDVVLAAVRLEDACPELYTGYNALDAPGASALAARWQQDWSAALAAFRRVSRARLLCCNYCEPAFPSLGLADCTANPSQVEVIRGLNQWLARTCAEVGDALVLDMDALAARVGRAQWTDPGLWFHARLAIAPAHHWSFAGQVTRLLRASAGLARKVLALDCDETLWGGILGEVGREGIVLGQDYPGSAFRAFQQRALELWRRGVVLVLASKNEPAAVRDVLENHPDIVLRPEHIAYFGVNWAPKSENLRSAAETLNLGLDSFVFLDNDAVECAMMRQMIPEVLTVQMPADPANYEATLAALDCFDQLTVSDEDRARGTLYRQESARAELKAAAGDLESFYRQLAMRVRLAINDPATASRAAQLTQRTNQFNMTPVRRTESEIRDLMHGGRHEVITLRLEDRFGDNGLVGLAVVERGGEGWTLDTFLMSCRVLGRTVEQGFLAWIAQRARAAGAPRLVGLYRPTAKNKPFAEFYLSCGMRPMDTVYQNPPRQAGGQCDAALGYEYDLSASALVPALPPWIEISEPSA